jgi:hypothetical protein
MSSLSAWQVPYMLQNSIKYKITSKALQVIFARVVNII